jgi:hypothetical protein
MGCRLTIKLGSWRILYVQFYNDKNMFKNYKKNMIESKVPRKTIDEIIEDIKTNLMFEKVITYKLIEEKMFWNQ